jgi:hypothetical protein
MTQWHFHATLVTNWLEQQNQSVIQKEIGMLNHQLVLYKVGVTNITIALMIFVLILLICNDILGTDYNNFTIGNVLKDKSVRYLITSFWSTSLLYCIYWFLLKYANKYCFKRRIMSQKQIFSTSYKAQIWIWYKCGIICHTSSKM